MSVVPKETRRRILSPVMEFIHAEGLTYKDNFPGKITQVYASIIEETGELPDQQGFLKKAGSLRTSFFRINTRITKRSFLIDLLQELNQEIKPFLHEIRKAEEQIPPGETVADQIFVDDIDSFAKVKKVSPKDVKDLVPVKVKEAVVKQSLADIIGESFVPKDWGGEKSDLYSSQVLCDGKRMSTAFLLKGPSVKKLTIARCGKNGDQLLRLTREPAQLFVVQHVGEIDTAVTEMLDSLVSNLSRDKKRKMYYCIMDGTDTARVLKAYDKI